MSGKAQASGKYKQKAPALSIMVRDLLTSQVLCACSEATVGFWIRFLASAYLNRPQGQLDGTLFTIGRHCAATPEQAREHLVELANATARIDKMRGGPDDEEAPDLAEVDVLIRVENDNQDSEYVPLMSRDCPGNVPVMSRVFRILSRQMSRQYNAREYERLRKQEYRRHIRCPGDVPEEKPGPSSSSSSSPSSSEANSETPVLSKANGYPQPQPPGQPLAFSSSPDSDFVSPEGTAAPPSPTPLPNGWVPIHDDLFAHVINRILGPNGKDQHQFNADITTYRRMATQINTGKFGEPMKVAEKCKSWAGTLHVDKATRNKHAAFTDWFKREIVAKAPV